MGASNNLSGQFDWATTSVRRNRAHNVESARLHARRDHLVNHVVSPDGSRRLARRLDFAMRAAELQSIETVLQDRGELDVRITNPPVTR